jgi:hypothetical protein
MRRSAVAISEIMFDTTAPGGASVVLLSFLDTPKPSGGEVILGFVTADVHAFVARARTAGGNGLNRAGGWVRSGPTNFAQYAKRLITIWSKLVQISCF